MPTPRNLVAPALETRRKTQEAPGAKASAIATTVCHHEWNRAPGEIKTHSIKTHAIETHATKSL